MTPIVEIIHHQVNPLLSAFIFFFAGVIFCCIGDGRVIARGRLRPKPIPRGRSRNRRNKNPKLILIPQFPRQRSDGNSRLALRLPGGAVEEAVGGVVADGELLDFGVDCCCCGWVGGDIVLEEDMGGGGDRVEVDLVGVGVWVWFWG